MGGSSKTRPGPSDDAGDTGATQGSLSDDAVTRPWPADPADPSRRSPTEVVPPSNQPGDTGEATQTFSGSDAVTRSRSADPAGPPRRPPTEVARHGPPDQVVRYGPGVPAAMPGGHAGPAAEQVWRSGHPSAPARRRPRPLRLLGSALTVILLAASGVVLYLRFHHAPFHVTGVAISQLVRTGCGVDVTGKITTDGAPGTVTYQWLFVPSQQPPRPQNQSVTADQQAVYVTVAVLGSGHGSARRTVTLQVLGPDPRTASAAVVLRC